jgi:hypothetical protein
MNDGRAARGMGVFSAGLGLAEIIAPRFLGRMTGVRNHAALMRAMGARELAIGASLWALPQQATGFWARLGGDVIDLALLGLAASSSRNRGRLMVALAVVAGVTAIDFLLARRAQGSHWRPAVDPKARWRPAPA